jgi:hypothetical protein
LKTQIVKLKRSGLTSKPLTVTNNGRMTNADPTTQLMNPDDKEKLKEKIKQLKKSLNEVSEENK